MSAAGSVIALDRDLTLDLNALGDGGFWDALMVFSSHHYTWVPLYVGLLVYLFYRLGWKRGLVFLAAIGLTFLCCDQLSGVFKHFFARLRPCHDAEMVSRGLRILEAKGGLYGFFSAHAANTFGLACCTIVAFRTDKRIRYRGLLYGLPAWALLVSVSRVFVGKHFLGDVLVGMVIGVALGLLLGYAARWVIRRWKIG